VDLSAPEAIDDEIMIDDHIIARILADLRLIPSEAVLSDAKWSSQ
jgi:pSer/pThr/pTyr-binding forkhead associated (FHA) protein